ncbi:MAG: MBL fold metallo-hydrolase [Deltaproteobacteria bacterium]|nr:MBL fold metallo-hydrolase [Deltaproteobacteria bacterium]
MGALLLFAAGGLSLSGAWTTTGARAKGARLERMQASPQWRDGRFRNALARHDGPYMKMMKEWFFGGSPDAEPSTALSVQGRSKADFDAPPQSGLRITWLGHSTFLVEIDGHNILVDPVWGERTSPLTWVGPKRFYDPPLPMDALPRVDAVVISHDHYDHLDYPSIIALSAKGVPFYVPLGIGAHLEFWGVPADRIHEHDWWQESLLGDLTLAAVPARHFSGRSMVMADQDQTLWAGWVLKTEAHRVFYSGDTAMFPGFEEIGQRHGPFDVALIETGAYDPLWADVHLGPEQALVAAQMVGAKLYMPVHWGCFNLALHSWTEPIERVVAAAPRMGVPIAVPRPGESVEPSNPPQVARWWPETRWTPAGEKLVMSSGLSEELAARVRRAHEVADVHAGGLDAVVPVAAAE